MKLSPIWMQGARVDREDRITPSSMVLLDVYIFDVAQNRTARANSDIKCNGDFWVSTICLKQTTIQPLIERPPHCLGCV